MAGTAGNEPEGMPRIAGFAEWLGIRVAGWDERGPHLVLALREEHINRNGSVHGGVLLTLLDSACSLAGLRQQGGHLVGRVTAVSVTANFISPVSCGTLHARARLRGGGRKLALVDAEIHDDNGTLAATGSGVIRRIEASAAQEENPA